MRFLTSEENGDPFVIFELQFTLYNVELVPNFEFVDKILKYDHLNEHYEAVLSCGVVYYAVYYAIQGDFNLRVCGRSLKCQ